jgi:hypothetical protein
MITLNTPDSPGGISYTTPLTSEQSTALLTALANIFSFPNGKSVSDVSSVSFNIDVNGNITNQVILAN